MDVLETSFNLCVNAEVEKYTQFMDDASLMLQHPLVDQLEDNSDESVKSFFSYVTNEEENGSAKRTETRIKKPTTGSKMPGKPKKHRRPVSRGKDLSLMKKLYNIPDEIVEIVDASTVKKKRKTKDHNRTMANPLAVADAERKYCWCNGLSSGKMIACDNSNCEREWFHFGCVNLLPDQDVGVDKWYCSAWCKIFC